MTGYPICVPAQARQADVPTGTANSTGQSNSPLFISLLGRPGPLRLSTGVAPYRSIMTALVSAAVLTPMLLPSWLDPEHLIHLFGPYALWGVAFIVFAECGLFAILPGDSLLFTIGLFVAVGVVNHPLWFVCVVLTLAAIAGNVCGYTVGRKIGPPLFKPRPGPMGRIFRESYVERTRRFFDRYGHRALILARFVPVVRTFVTLVAGVSRMNFRRFIGFTAIGGVAWACGVTIAGYYLGNITIIKNNIDVVLILIVLLSLVPVGLELLLHRRRSSSADTGADPAPIVHTSTPGNTDTSVRS